MYSAHVPIINAAMRAEADIFLRGVTFAVLSIRTQFIRVSAQMAEVDAANSKARALWGYKRGAYDFLRLNKYRLWEAMKATANPEVAISTMCEVPGIGIVKAAFIGQMMGFDIGCLDTRNIQRLGLNPREYRTDGTDRKQTDAFKRKVSRYVASTLGQGETLWDDWCADVGKVYGVSAEDISREHLTIIPKGQQSRYIKIVRERNDNAATANSRNHGNADAYTLAQTF